MEITSAINAGSSVIWVLVANGTQAQIYRYNQSPLPAQEKQPGEKGGAPHALTPVPEMRLLAESLDDFQVGHDGRGSLIGGTPSGHNTCEPRLDIRDEVKQNLVTALATKLGQAFEIKAFDHLVIAASPKILGELRQQLNTAVSDSIIAEIDKDFTNDTSLALLDHLEKTFSDAHIS